MQLPKINLDDYQYELPEHRIASFPLEKRDDSKLLVYQEGNITHWKFNQLGAKLPENSTLIFNNTKVIPARMIFRKPTGAIIEIFLLEPKGQELQLAMQATGYCQWMCMIGNLRRWKSHQKLSLPLTVGGQNVNLIARQCSPTEVEFTWDGDSSFSAILEAAGRVPLPPYLKRDPVPADKERYQTVYSKMQGAVAAPTAGLHFTEPLLQSMRAKSIAFIYLTLHVGAGTFQPIQTQDIIQHPMHREHFSVSLECLEQLAKPSVRVAVGTTSLRTLESLYWIGVKLKGDPLADFHLEKLFPYQDHKDLPSFEEALEFLADHLRRKGLNTLSGSTEVFIFPPYPIRSCMGLITNFHLPGSTLILLVAAFIGADWKKVYREALTNDYRFLSYGDSSLLWYS